MRTDQRLGMLPDPFVFLDGSRVKTIEDWRKRRQEILDTAVELEFGGMPPRPDRVRLERLSEGGVRNANCYRVHCYVGERDFTFSFIAYRPEGKDKCPVIITGDAMYHHNLDDKVMEEAHRRGFAVIKFIRTELAPDMYNTDRSDGIYPLWPDLKFSAISAWAWGYHRVVDVLPELEYIDTEHITITGHSRGGKTVLLAGATDERIEIVNPNGSGTHGCGCYRFVQHEEDGLYKDNKSEELDFMFDVVPYWLGEGMRKYIKKEDQLPHDMHFIKALVAPRVFLETNGYGDIWGNPRGSYLSFLAAKEVWKFYGKENLCQTWYREGGHRHGWADFNALFDLMETVIYGKDLWVEQVPYTDMEKLYDWSVPTMTKKERLMRFLKNQPVDRVPVAFFHHFCPQQEWGRGLINQEAFERNIAGHGIARQKFDPDVIKIMNDSLMIMPVNTTFVENAADLRRIQPPGRDSLFAEKTKELTLRAMALYEGSDAAIYATGFSPAMVLRTSLMLQHPMLPGQKSLLVQFLEEDPDSVLDALDKIAAAIMEINEMLVKECGVDGIYLSVNNQAHVIPDELYARYITPNDKKVMAHANALSNMNILHICGYQGKANNLELFKDYEAAAINWAVHAEGVSLSEGKKLFGGKPVLGGFEQDTVIYKGTREEVEQFTWKILDEAGQVGVMIGADCTVPNDIDDTRLEWVRQACVKYAKTHR